MTEHKDGKQSQISSLLSFSVFGTCSLTSWVEEGRFSAMDGRPEWEEPHEHAL